MGVAFTSFDIEAEFSGVGGGWTSIKNDIRAAGGSFDIVLKYGIPGTGPTDRVAAPGTLTFALENTTANSGGVVGYYSFNHASKRTGFTLGIRVRYSIVSGGVTYYKFIGTIDSIVPVAGKVNRVSYITCVDWMDEAARYQIQGVPAALGTDADAVLTAILAVMPKQPNATSFGNGSDAYAFAPAAGPSERFTALSEFQRIAMSELGYIVIRGGTSAGAAGTLSFISRAQLVQSPYNASQVTLTNTMSGMGARVSRDSVLNVFRCTTHPRRYDSTAGDRVTLFEMPNSVPIENGAAAVTILGQYRDPAQQAARVSGYGMMGAAGQDAMVNGTDYYFTSNPDGTGTDLSGSLTFTASPGSEGVKYTVSASATGFFWAQARGYGIYDYEPTTIDKRDTTSVTAYGENPIDLDFYYQSDPTWGQIAGAYLLPYWKDPTTVVPAISFLANKSSTNMLHALAREPGDSFTAAETTTGVNKQLRIHQIELVMREDILTCTWMPSPMVDTTDYWVLEDGSGLGDVGETVLAL